MAFQSGAFQANAFQFGGQIISPGGGAGEIIRIETFSRKRWREFLKERKQSRDLIEAQEREAQEDEDIALALLLGGDAPISFTGEHGAEAVLHRFRGDEDDDELAATLLLLSGGS